MTNDVFLAATDSWTCVCDNRIREQKIKPLIAQRFPLAGARHAHELLGKGGVTGKIVLVRNGSALESGAA